MTLRGRILLVGALAVTIRAAWGSSSSIREVDKDILAYIRRVQQCIHWVGAVGTGGPDREAQIARATEELRCHDLRTDADWLRSDYRDNSAACAAVTTAERDWLKTIKEPKFDVAQSSLSASTRNTGQERSAE